MSLKNNLQCSSECGESFTIRTQQNNAIQERHRSRMICRISEINLVYFCNKQIHAVIVHIKYTVCSIKYQTHKTCVDLIYCDESGCVNTHILLRGKRFNTKFSYGHLNWHEYHFLWANNILLISLTSRSKIPLMTIKKNFLSTDSLKAWDELCCTDALIAKFFSLLSVL